MWSPRSNVTLYGATANIPLALDHGINIALGAESAAFMGSENLLEELRFAGEHAAAHWPGRVTPSMLVAMVTTNAAKLLGLSHVIGSLAENRRADITVIAGDVTKPYETIVSARPRDVRLVLVDGVAQYGDANLQSLGSPGKRCETLNVCDRAKFLCIADADASAPDKLGQTLGDIQSILSAGLAQYDAQSLKTPLAPIADLFTCP